MILVKLYILIIIKKTIMLVNILNLLKTSLDFDNFYIKKL